MSVKANPARIGMFVLGAIILLVACLIVFGSGKFFQKTNPFVSYFSGSLSGLSVGAPVTYRGVPIGSVTAVRVEMFTETLTARVPVYFEITPDRLTFVGEMSGSADERIEQLIKKGLRAELVSQSLVTGQLAIQLDFKPDTPIHLVGADTSVIEIPTVPSAIQQLMGQLQKLKLEGLVDRATKLIADVDALIDTPEAKELVPGLKKLVDDAERLVNNLDTEVKPLLASFQKAADSATGAFDEGKTALAHLDTELKPAVADIRKLVREVNDTLPRTMKSLDSLLAEANGAIKPDSGLMKDVRRALTEFSAAAYAVRALAEELERNPSTLIRGK